MDPLGTLINVYTLSFFQLITRLTVEIFVAVEGAHCVHTMLSSAACVCVCHTLINIHALPMHVEDKALGTDHCVVDTIE